MTDTSKTLPTGAILHSGTDTYTIVKVLGQGGFGITYLATGNVKHGNIKVKAQFAIKEHFIDRYCERNGATHAVSYSRPVADEVEDSRKDFLSEARRLRDLSNSNNRHPNIVSVNETFEANNTAYFVMEYLDGESLSSYVKRYGPLSDDEMRAVMEPIIDAVAFLHRERITHLDIKPANIMLTQDDDGNLRPVLIDFGLSRHFNAETGEPSCSIQQAGFSTGYAPVEQVEAFSHFYPGTDVYSLGATMLYALTGKTPVAAADLDDETLCDSLPDGLPESTVKAITAAMHHFRKHRPENASALMTILTDKIIPDIYQSSEHIHAPKLKLAFTPKPMPEQESESASKPTPESKPAVTSEPKRKSRAGLFIIMFVVSLLAAFGIVWLTQGFGLLDKTKTEESMAESAPIDADPDMESISGSEEMNQVTSEAINEPESEEAAETPVSEAEETAKEESPVEDAVESPVEEPVMEEKPVSTVETVTIKPHSTANHLDLAVKYAGGKVGFFSSDEWTTLPQAEQSRYQKLGMAVVTRDQRFMVELYDRESGRETTWKDAVNVYGNVMPNYSDGAALVSIGWRKWKEKMNAYDGDATDYFWIRVEFSATHAFLICMNYGLVDTYLKTSPRRIRAVMPLPR